MKKIIAISVLFMLILTGCKNTNNKENISDNNEADIRFINYDTNCYGNGMIYGNNPAMFLDFDNMKTSPLCAMPNCTHTTSECLGQIIGDTPIMINDEIYYFIKNGTSGNGEFIETPDGPEFNMSSKLMKASVASSETEVVCEFNDALPRDSGYVIVDSLIYFTAYNPDPEINEAGIGTLRGGGGYEYLCSIDIKTGKYTNYGSICYVEEEYPSADKSSHSFISGFYKGKIYITYGFTKEEYNHTESTTPPEFTFYNFEFDIKNKSLIESNLPHALYADNNTYIYNDKENCRTVVINEDKTYSIDYSTKNTAVRFFDNKVFFSDFWYDIINERSYDRKNKSYCTINTYYDDYYIIQQESEFLKLTEKELLTLE